MKWVKVNFDPNFITMSAILGWEGGGGGGGVVKRRQFAKNCPVSGKGRLTVK